MAQFFTNFSDDTIGQAPIGWTAIGAYTFNTTVENSGWSSSGRHLNIGTVGTNNQRKILKWDTLDEQPSETVETYIRFRSIDTANQMEVVSRLVGVPTTGNFLIAGQSDATNTNRIVHVNSGTFGTLQTQSFTITVGTTYHMRTQAIGTDFRMRIWADPDPEPGTWNLTGTVTPIAAGGVGFFLWRATGNMQVECVGVGIEGDVAPIEALAPPPPPPVIEPPIKRSFFSRLFPILAAGAGGTISPPTLAPSNVQAFLHDTRSIRWQWDSASNVTGYKIRIRKEP